LASKALASSFRPQRKTNQAGGLSGPTNLTIFIWEKVGEESEGAKRLKKKTLLAGTIRLP